MPRAAYGQAKCLVGTSADGKYGKTSAHFGNFIGAVRFVPRATGTDTGVAMRLSPILLSTLLLMGCYAAPPPAPRPEEPEPQLFLDPEGPAIGNGDAQADFETIFAATSACHGITLSTFEYQVGSDGYSIFRTPPKMSENARMVLISWAGDGSDKKVYWELFPPFAKPLGQQDLLNGVETMEKSADEICRIVKGVGGTVRETAR